MYRLRDHTESARRRKSAPQTQFADIHQSRATEARNGLPVLPEYKYQGRGTSRHDLDAQWLRDLRLQRNSTR